MTRTRLNTCLAFLMLFFATVSTAQAQNLVSNGDFEAGLADWNEWAAAPNSFWDGVWIQSNDCNIWVPTNGCPFAGATSHAQKKGSGAGNAHGGLTQVLSVQPGRSYDVSGQWSGGVTGNVDGNNGSWWEVVIYDGLVDDATIDAGLRQQDTLISKREINNLANQGVFQFQWETFSGSFTAQSDTVTLVLKAGSFYTLDAAAYHDDIEVVAQAPTAPIPVNSFAALALLMGLMVLLGMYSLRRHA